ncbi:unnamed protein product [Peronospora belbahrii]|uniref:J domain-containing protein n=1 Tax=Peronospora belbahrii TaxID=622444 RepID=A0ABN8CSK3_9STRA|nr:unnamed protein product [Peronospora belbahrii]
MAASRMTRRATAPKELQELAHQIKRAPFSNGAPKEIPMINLHDGEAQAFRHLAHSIVSRTLAHESEYHRMKRPELSQRDWKLLKRHNTFNIYKRRSSREHEQGHATGNSKRPMVLCVGSIAGHLEDTLYGLHAKNHDEMQLILPYMSKNHVDCAFLAKLEEGLPTDPYRQLALKWHKSDALSEPKIMKLRDLCMLESMGISTDAQGERYAYCLLQSVDVAGCPPPPETSNVVRANLMSCCIFRQAPGTNVVNVYAKGMFDLGGDVPSFLVYSTSCSFMYSIMNAVESAESKRLTLLALQKAESIMSLPIEEISTLDLEYHELIRSTNMSSVSNSASSPSADGGYFTQKRIESVGRAFHKRVRNITRGRSASCDEVDDAATARNAVRKQEETILRKYRRSIRGKNFLDLTMYQQLGLSDIGFNVTDDQVKKAYHRVLIEHHPDKTGKTENDPNYLAVQKAFATLMDPQKKRAYDSQCDFDEWIPSGNEKLAENDPNGDGKSFYQVYGPVFQANARFSVNQPVPMLGTDESPIDEVYAFYDFWNKFDSWRDFTHDSEHDVESAEHRDHKRWMAKKNDAVAKKKKKKEYARLASLVDRALAVDPRIRRVKQAEKDRKLQAKREKEAEAQRLIDEENRKKEEAERAAHEVEEKEKEARKDAKMAKDKQKKLFRKVKKAFRELMVAASEQELDGAIDIIKTEDLCESLDMEALQTLVTVRKKQFINKKKAQHFHVVHRSQRDPKADDPNASKYVLLSSNPHVKIRSDSEFDGENDNEEDVEIESDDEMPDLVDAVATKTIVAGKKSRDNVTFPIRKVRFGDVEAEDFVDENGLPRDGYNYLQHMKEMGKGKFYSATSRFDAGEDARALSRKVDLPQDALPSMEEQDRLLDAITLTTDVMDEDLREALVNDEAFEQLDDNFVIQAAEENLEFGTADDFDYDTHIAKLMNAASGVTPLYRGNITDSEDDGFSEDDEEFSDEEAEHGDEGEVPEDRDEAQRVLDELFEKTLAEEYDDEQLGELEEDDPETRGKETLDGELLAVVLEDYVSVQQELADAEGKLGNPLRAGNRLKQVLEECDAERHAYEYDEDAETEEEEGPEDEVARAEREEKELQELYERNLYLQREERERWDCETIVSTYSTLDNHPTVLREEAPTRRKKKKQPVMASVAMGDEICKQKVTLSRKTGMPLGVFEAAAPFRAKGNKQQEPEMSRRQKGETTEQKRARKAAVKMEKVIRRSEKRDTKLAFKEEEARQSTQMLAGRVSIFRY